MTSAYNLFKENLGVAEMLIYVHAFNLSNWALELDFVLGEKDMEQWKVSIGKITHGFTMSGLELKITLRLFILKS